MKSRAAEFHRDDPKKKPLSESDRASKTEEYTQGISGLRAQLGVADDAPESALEQHRDKAPDRFNRLDALKGELEADKANRSNFDKFQGEARAAKGRMLGEVPDAPLSVFQHAEKVNELKERRSQLEKDQESIVEVRDGAVKAYEDTIGQIDEGLQASRQAGQNVHDMAESLHGAKMAKLAAQSELYEQLGGVEVAQHGFDEELMTFEVDADELDEQAKASENRDTNTSAASTAPTNGSPLSEEEQPAISTPAIVSEGNISLEGEALGEEKILE